MDQTPSPAKWIRMRVEGRELLAENMLVQEVVLHFQRILSSSIVIWGSAVLGLCWVPFFFFNI